MLLAQATTRNKKTGNIPTLIIGQTDEQTLTSCQQSGCELLHTKYGGSGAYKEKGLRPCYAHASSVSWATKSIRKAIEKGTKTIKDYSVKEAFRLSAREARYFRLSSIGDCSILPRETIDMIVETGKKYNLIPLGYTAGWRKRNDLQDVVLASNITQEDADKAISKGWRATCQVPKTTRKTFVTPDGNLGIVCPEQTQANSGKEVTPRNKITCNTCGLCAKGNTHPTKYKVIGFYNH